MNYYVNLISETIDYIEDNIHEKLSLEDLAAQFHVSRFHFNRMFKTVYGMTLKQYILGRKLTQAIGNLKDKDSSVIDTAFDYGFEYPEVFSRAFKKQFGISPSECRHESINVNLVKKLSVVEREIINCRGTLTLNGTELYLKELHLEGVCVEVDTNSDEFKPLMVSTNEGFMKAAQEIEWLNHEMLYVAVNCHQDDSGEYTVFYGMEGEPGDQKTEFQKHIIPQGWYAGFKYKGDMFDIREAFIDDLYRWIMVREIQLNHNGVGMLNIFGKDYLTTHEVDILVPIKKSHRQQEMS